MPSSKAAGAAAEVARQAAGLRPLVETVLACGEVDAVLPEAVQQGLTALIKLYAAQWEAGARFAPVAAGGDLPATAAMILATALLKAVHVELFELGMWQAWAGR